MMENSLQPQDSVGLETPKIRPCTLGWVWRGAKREQRASATGDAVKVELLRKGSTESGPWKLARIWRGSLTESKRTWAKARGDFMLRGKWNNDLGWRKGFMWGQLWRVLTATLREERTGYKPARPVGDQLLIQWSLWDSPLPQMQNVQNLQRLA